MQVTITVLLGAAATIYLRRLIMATRAENQARLDGIAEAQEKAAAVQSKAYDEILAGINDLREQAANAGQELDFTRVEGGAGLLAEGAGKLDALHDDKVEEPVPGTDVPPATETETPPASPENPVADGASVDGAPQA